MWYWYFSGVVSVLFVQSIILNIAQANGLIQWRKPTKLAPVYLYDQDKSGEIKRSA